MNIEHIKRFQKLHLKVTDACKQAVNDGAGSKSYDGMMNFSIDLPAFYEDDSAPLYHIHLQCYLIGPTRSYDWFGLNADECLNKAEADIQYYIKSECY